MIIKSAELKDFRNYKELNIDFDKGTNIIYGNNAQGKTNILEALYVGCTSKSHKSVKDKELIRFGCDESHIKLTSLKNEINYRIDIHIKKNKAKGIAINTIPIRRTSELLGIANVVFFSPEDLSIIKNGPSERRRFLDIELCQLNNVYTHDLISYTRVINQKNKLLKEADSLSGYEDMIDVYNEQLINFGSKIINIRKDFTDKLNTIISDIHNRLTDGRENIKIIYEPDTTIDDFEKNIKKNKFSEFKQKISLVGPHRDDICFMINDIDVRKYGSQGQQRTAALSLKLAEIKIIEEITSDKPILLLDDVMSELDRKRQKMLLESIENIQTIMTCTGLDDLIYDRFKIDKVFYIENGKITGDS